MANKFPKVLFVKWEEDGKDSYPVACETLNQVADIGEQNKIGIYRLESIETVECSARVVVKRRGR